MFKYAIILPCYNEEKRFPVSAFLNELANIDNINVLLVNDGSSDYTNIVLDSLLLKSTKIQVLHLPRNIGKAEAIRAGYNQVLKRQNFNYIGYFDADLATPLLQLQLFIEAIRVEKSRKVLFGSRIKRAGAEIVRNPTRHYAGRILATVINKFILKIPIYDSQCGAKLFSNEIALEIFKEPFLSKWLFDVEIVVRLQEKFNPVELKKMFYEVPLTVWTEKGESKIKFIDIALIPISLVKIFFSHQMTKRRISRNLKLSEKAPYNV